MGSPTGDQNVSQSGFDQNSFLIARGRASVPFDAKPHFSISVWSARRPPGLVGGLGGVFGLEGLRLVHIGSGRFSIEGR